MKFTKTKKTSRTAFGTERFGKTVISKKSSNHESPDAVCEEIARTKSKFSTRILPADEANDVPLVLIEADREALILLGRLFIAQAHAAGDSVQVAPKSAGKRLFTQSSTIGLYIHRRGRLGQSSR
jgi:hypothetical protein